MSNYDLYRKRVCIEQTCKQKNEANFITEGSSATEIYVVRTKKNRQAGLIITDQEGPDTTLVFTYIEPAAQSEFELYKGDYFIWPKYDKWFFVYEDLYLVRETIYKKQKAYECNVMFEIDGQCYHAWYTESLKKYEDTTLQQSINITDNDKPVLIIPTQPWIKIGLKLIIGGKPFKIIDFDAFTNEGIVYCSLDRDFISKQDDVIPEPEPNTITAGIEQTITTQNGYFTANPDVEIVERTLTKVVYVVPYGVSNVTIGTKQNGEIVTTTYKVVT